jgi:hypothetical protein
MTDSGERNFSVTLLDALQDSLDLALRLPEGMAAPVALLWS